MNDMWRDVVPKTKIKDIEKIVVSERELEAAYVDIARHLNRMDFEYIEGEGTQARQNPSEDKTYKIIYGRLEDQVEASRTPARFVANVLHEMMHVTAALQYETNIAPQGGNVEHMANMNLPVGTGELDNSGVAENQNVDIGAQLETMSANWSRLHDLSEEDTILSKAQKAVITARWRYAQDATHNDTVLVDLLFYLANEGHKVQDTKPYKFAQLMLWEANSRRRSGKGRVQDLTKWEG